MKRILSLLLAAFTSLACAATPLIYDDGQVRITLSEDKPCESKMILDMVKPSERWRFFSAVEVYKGRTIVACWALTPDGQIVIADEEGDAGALDPSRLSRAKEV